MKKPNVALISPQVIGANQIRKAPPPMGIAYLAAVLEEKGFENILLVDAVVEDYDNVIKLDDIFERFGLSDEDMVKKLKKFKPDLVGISVLFASQMECALSLAKAIKEEFPQVPIVMGGNHASQVSDSVIKNECLDFIICGEGEYVFPEFLEKYFGNKYYKDVPGLVWYGNRVHKNPQPPFITDLDALPFPAFHMYDMEKYFEISMMHNPFVKSPRVGSVFTTRGCPSQCYYCSVPRFLGNRFRAMSSKRTIEYIQYLIDKFGIKELQILDDNFTVNYKRAVEVFEGIKHFNLRICFPNAVRGDMPKNREKRRKMYSVFHDAGVEQMDFSPEHGDQDFLKNVLHKNLDLEEIIVSADMSHDLGMLVHINVMMGFPFETKENRQKTIDFAYRVDADSYSVSLVAPLPNTPLWDVVEENDLFVESFDINRMVLARVNIKPYDISIEELYELTDRLNRELNEMGQVKRPATTEKYRLFKGKSSGGDRKFHFIDK